MWFSHLIQLPVTCMWLMKSPGQWLTKSMRYDIIMNGQLKRIFTLWLFDDAILRWAQNWPKAFEARLSCNGDGVFRRQRWWRCRWLVQLFDGIRPAPTTHYHRAWISLSSASAIIPAHKRKRREKNSLFINQAINVFWFVICYCLWIVFVLLFNVNRLFG